MLPGSQDAIADPAAMTWAEVPGRLAPARTYWLGGAPQLPSYCFGAPKRRTSPLPPHRRQVPQRRLLLPAFFLLPLHDGQRRIGWRCMSTHQATTAMAATSTTTPVPLTASLP